MQDSPSGRRGGNPCTLDILGLEPTSAPTSRDEATICQSWPTPNRSTPTISLRCFIHGRLIQCCGHGLLAAAYYWQRQLRVDVLSLQMNNSIVHSWREGPLTWLRFTTLVTRPCAVPEWIDAVFPGQAKPIAAATAGGEQDYQILQWSDATPLARLRQPASSLGEQTRRALICTAAQPGAGASAVQLRYFAPQYGVNEDSATGSAMRVLSHYWAPRFERLSAWQCSAAGGQLFSRFRDHQVEIGGRCVVETEPKYHPREDNHE